MKINNIKYLETKLIYKKVKIKIIISIIMICLKNNFRFKILIKKNNSYPSKKLVIFNKEFIKMIKEIFIS